MSKPIKITEDVFDKIVEEVKEKLKKDKMSNGQFEYKCNLSSINKDRATLMFTPTAYIKMKGLVEDFTSEIGWHGTVERIDEHTWLVDDIYVYPQTVSSATVTTDPNEYLDWTESLPDEVFNKLHFHGHSHVNFAVNASSVDMAHRDEIVSQLREDDFYIFVIVNKKNEWSSVIYDMAQNILYESKDIDLTLTDVSEDTLTFSEDSKKLVKQNKTVAATTKPAAAKAASKQTSKKKEKDSFGWQYEMDDMDWYRNRMLYD